jgi:hypothetical protein
MEKEGLQTAIDFTKFLLTLAGGAIAFVIKPEFFGQSPLLKYISIAALVLLTVCVISGLFVFSGGCMMLARKDYNLERKYVKLPGIINVVSFGLGFLLISFAVGWKFIWS